MTPAEKRKGGRPPRPEPAERLISYIPVDLKRRAEHLAVEERRSVTSIVVEALAAYLRRKRIVTR